MRATIKNETEAKRERLLNELRHVLAPKLRTEGEKITEDTSIEISDLNEVVRTVVSYLGASHNIRMRFTVKNILDSIH